MDQRSSSAGSSRGINALKALKQPEFRPSKFVQSISQKEVERRRAIWSQALGQTVADAAHWSSAPWDTMPARGSACTGMIHWIRLFTLASGMSCSKREMQSHCFDLLSHGAFFVQQRTCKQCRARVLRGAPGRYPWLQWPSVCSWLPRVCCRRLGDDWRRPGVKPVHSRDSSPSHPVTHPKKLGSNVSWGDDANIHTYFCFQSSWKPSVIFPGFEPFQRAV